MRTFRPDIVVISPDGEYLMIVEVKRNENQRTIRQLGDSMTYVGCSIGLAVCGERIILLRDSLEQPNGESINVVGEARLPDYLLPPADEHLLMPADEQWKREVAFESRVQQWLEQFKLTSSLKALPNDLKELLGGQIISLLRLGEIRAAHPRWSRVTS